MSVESKKLALRIALAAKAKKGQRLVILDVSDISTFCDYFVIASGTSNRQVNAIAQEIKDDLAKDRIKSLSEAPSNDETGWIALDFVSVIAHIFYKPMREFYSLERLWSDAKKVRVPASPRK